MGMPTLTAQQDAGVTAVAEWFKDATSALVDPEHGTPEFYFGGYAGTGKSTILPVIIDKLGLDPLTVEFVAPTGKAAKVMTEKLKAYGIDRRARTIHSLIYRPKPLQAEVLERQLTGLQGQRDSVIQGLHEDGDPDWKTNPRLVEIDKTINLIEKDLDRLFEQNDGPKFQLNPDSDIRKARLCVVDEASMVGDSIADDLRGFNVPIFAMGDPGQLPPVGDVPGLTAGDPDFFLTEIHRQAAGNPIIMLATMARKGETIRVGKYGDGVEVVSRLRDDATYDMNREAQIIVGTNKRRWQVTNKLRRAMGFKSSGPCAGEPLLICKNSRSVPDLVNGSFVNCVHDAGNLEEGNVLIKLLVEDEFGVQREIHAVQGIFEEHRLQQKGAATGNKMKVFRARIDNEHVDFGWAITCHKSQGSQWNDVVLHDESGVFREDSEKWLYTGITRAAKRLTIVL